MQSESDAEIGEQSRIPPPSAVFASPKPGRLAPEWVVSTATSGKANEHTQLIVEEEQGYAGGIARYINQGSIPDEYDLYAPPIQRRRRQLTFWAALLAICISSGLLVRSGWLLFSGNVSSGVAVASALGVAIASLSIAIEFASVFPKYSPSLLKWNTGKHALFDFVVCCFSALPFSQSHQLLGILFFIHLLPAVLFYGARAKHGSLQRFSSSMSA